MFIDEKSIIIIRVSSDTYDVEYITMVNKKLRFSSRVLFGILFLFSFSYLLGVSIDQTTTERIIKENRYFLKFINVSVSNFGKEEHENILKKANQHHFNAHMWYLQSNYIRSYQEIKRSQSLLRDLYLQMVDDYYREDARVLLDISAPLIIQSKDKKAEHFLKLGYRDLEESKVFREMGYNYNRFLFSNKIRYYIDAIKNSRRAKRFAFLAIIESKIPVEEKEEYKRQTLDDYLFKKEGKDKISSYEDTRNNLKNLINRKLITDNYNFFLHHDDNYAKISKEKADILFESSDELNMNAISGHRFKANK